MRNLDHGLGRGSGDFIIFAESSGMIEPREGAFHPPIAKGVFPIGGA
jgi:hypothetical protein